MEDRRFLVPMLGSLFVLIAALTMAAFDDAPWTGWFAFLALVGFVAFYVLTRDGVVWAWVILGMVLAAVVTGLLVD